MNMGRFAEEHGKKLLFAMLLALFLVLQYFIWLGEHGFARLWRLELTVENQREENLQLQSRNQQLKAEVQDLKQGTDALEERARSELGLIKNGETFYQIIDPKSDKKN